VPEEYLLAKMPWPKVEAALRKSDIVIIPVGSTEQHGRHIPVDNDHFVAFQMARQVAERLSPKLSVVVCPPVAYGISPHHMGFPGTITLTTETFTAMMKEIVRALIKHGFRKILIINGHGGNTAALQSVISDMKLESGLPVYLYQTNWWEIGSDVINKTCTPPVFHSEETETSVALALDQTIDMSEAKDEYPQTESSFVRYDVTAPGPQVRAALPGMRTITKSGTIGYPSKATKEKGTAIMNVVTERICQFLIEISKVK
jgi:creatinine amidohydrolase